MRRTPLAQWRPWRLAAHTRGNFSSESSGRNLIMSLQLMRCQPDPIALAAWAIRYGLLSPDGDYGYALHALLTAAFKGQAPKPFCYLGERQGLLAYTNNSLDSL